MFLIKGNHIYSMNSNNIGLPYITGSMPGIGGAIKQMPEHFIVEEVPLYEPCGDGKHLYINLTKKGLSTMDVIGIIGKILGINRNDIGAAGLKDKHAVSIQTISVPMNNESAGQISKKLGNEIQDESESITINWTKPHTNKLRKGHLQGNNFRILITDVLDAEALEKGEKICEELKKRGVPNYFGPQRFGTHGENAQKGRDILDGKRKERQRFLKMFFVSAFQSRLCNEYLASRVNDGKFEKIMQGDIAKKYETGGIFDVEDEAEDQKRFDAKEITFTAPIYGRKMRKPSGESGNFEQRILEENGVTDELIGRMPTGTRRAGRILIDKLDLKKTNEGIEVSFFLPKGSYATVVLREIMKNQE